MLGIVTDFLERNWPALAVCGALFASLIVCIRDLLTIVKLRTELAQLRTKSTERKSQIIAPTLDEIGKYATRGKTKRLAPSYYKKYSWLVPILVTLTALLLLLLGFARTAAAVVLAFFTYLSVQQLFRLTFLARAAEAFSGGGVITPQDYYHILVGDLNLEAKWLGKSPGEKREFAKNLSEDLGFPISEDELGGIAQHVFEAMSRQILDALPSETRQTLEGRVFVGEVMTGDYNAHACAVPGGGGYVFLVDTGLYGMMWDIINVVESQSQWGEFDSSGNPIPESISGEKELSLQEAVLYVRQIINHYLEYSVWRPPKKDGRYTILADPGKIQMASEMLYATLDFVLAHEFAHALLGHLENRDEDRLALPRTGRQLRIIPKSWPEEIMADQLAIEIIFERFPRVIDMRDPQAAVKVEAAVAAPFIFLETARLIERMGRIRHTTHPPPDDRLAAIEKKLKKEIVGGVGLIASNVRYVLRQIETELSGNGSENS